MQNQGFLDLFKTIASEYFDSIPAHLQASFVLKLYGIGSAPLSLKELEPELGFCRETARTRKKMYLSYLYCFLNGEKTPPTDITLNQKTVKLFQGIIKKIAEQPFYIYDDLIAFIGSEFGETLDESKLRVLQLFFDTIGIDIFCIIRANKPSLKLASTQNQNRKKLRLNITTVLQILRKSTIPISEKGVIAQVKIKINHANEAIIKQTLRVFPEITNEKLDNNTIYQIVHSKKSRISNLAYQLLLNEDRVMHYDEIMAKLIELNPSASKPNFIETKKLYLANDKRFKPIYRTGYWSLTEWNISTDTLRTIIETMLREQNKPTTGEKLLSLVFEIRPYAKINSIKTEVAKYCVAVGKTDREFKKNIFILPQWQSRYPELVALPKKTNIVRNEKHFYVDAREKLIAFMKNYGNPKPTVSEITTNFCLQHPDIKKSALYYLFKDKKYFTRSLNANNKLIIQLKK